MLQTAGRGIRCQLPSGEVIHVLPEHRYLSWNPVEYSAFRKAVRPGTVAFDVGANVGAYSLLFGQWVGPAGRVYGFEPSPRAFSGLARHVELNRLQPIVHPIAAAVSDAVGGADLAIADTAGESRLTGSGENRPTITVPTVTIDAFCARESVTPGFIKIDVEGAELAVLRGARATIARGGIALFVELHPSIWPLLGVTRDHLAEELDRQRLTIEPLTDGDPWAVEGIAVRLVPR